jgi:pentatricopeptide repeat protein
MTKPGSQRNPIIDSLKDRIARDPFSRAFLQLAEEYRREGRFQEAIEVCLDGLQRHPTYHTARISLGRTYMEAADLDKAKQTFMEVLELQPENHLAGKLLAEIQKKMGDLNGAAATYRGILSYYPNDREVATLLQEAQRGGFSPAPTGASAPNPSAAGRPPAQAAPPQRPIIERDAPARPAQARAGAGVPAGVHPLPRPATPLGRLSDPAPDFTPADLGVGPTPPSHASAGPPAVGRPSWPAFRAEEESRPAGDALQTNTLAELYLRQGLVDKATEVYRSMLRVDPANEKAARRLSELGLAGVPRPGTPAGTPAPPAPRVVTAAPQPIVTQPAAVPILPEKSDDGPRRETIRRLERWLATMGSPDPRGGAPR